MTEVSQTFVSWCAQTWPKFAPEQIALQEPQPSDVPFEFDAQQTRLAGGAVTDCEDAAETLISKLLLICPTGHKAEVSQNRF